MWKMANHIGPSLLISVIELEHVNLQANMKGFEYKTTQNGFLGPFQMELVSALTLPHVKLANPIKLVSVFKKARGKNQNISG